MAARIAGANPIIAVDIIPKRLKLALELGATHSINNKHENISSRIRGITGKGVDYIVETTGFEDLQDLAIQLLNPKGIVGLLTGETGTDALPEGKKSIGIIQGNSIPQHSIPRLMALYQKGEFPYDRLLKFYDFKDINKAIEDSKRGSTIKPVLVFD